MLRQCPGSGYGPGVATTKRLTKQRTVGVDDELWKDCLLIAEAKRQKLSDVMRAALVRYREDNLETLERERARRADESSAS